jgi:AIG2-like family
VARKVWTFWYGSYMNTAVLAEVDLRPDSFEVARLDAFDIRIEPLANLVRSDGSAVYGVLAQATHEELDRLYAHARNVLGAVYLPEAVLVQTRDLTWRPALCYIASEMEARPAERAYVERILRPARDLGFPSWYVKKLEGFLR